MKKLIPIILSVCLFSLFNHLNAQISWNWAESLGGASDDEALDIAIDNQGNTYVVGVFKNTIVTSVNTITSAGNTDIFIAKFDTTGNIVWIRSGGGTTDFDRGEAIDVDQNGNVFVTGYFGGSATFDIITLNSGVSPNAVFIAKYDTNGNIQWVQRGINFNSNPNAIVARPYDIKVDSLNNVYVTGQKSQPLTFGSTTIVQLGTDGSFLAKFDNNGNILFGISVSNPSISFRPAKLQILNNKIYVLYVNISSNAVLEVAKFDENGNLLKTFPNLLSGSYAQNANQLHFAVASDESIYLYAESQGVLQIGNIISSSINSSCLLVAGLDSLGAFKWKKQLGDLGEMEGGMTINTTNNIFITGSFNNSISIDTTLLPNTGQDIFVAGFDLNGNTVQINTAQSSNMVSNALAVNDFGEVYVTGRYVGTAIFDNNQIVSNGSSEVFIAKLDCIPPPINDIIGDTSVCLGTSIYRATTFRFSDSLTWTLSGGGTITTNGDSAIVNFTQTGIYTLSTFQSNECGDGEIFTIDITVTDVPDAPIINGDSSNCLGLATYNFSNISNIIQWSVSGGGNIFPIGNTLIVDWTSLGTHTVNLVTENSCGFNTTSTLDVDILEVPNQTSLITGNTNACQSTQNYSVIAEANTNYTWSLSSGGTITSNNNTATINWTTAGTHTLSVTPFNDCGVGSARSVLVTVTEVPQQPSTVVGNLTVCKGLQSYSVIGNTSTSYNWTISGGGNISASNSNATVNWQTAGTYTMTITPSNVCGVGTPRTVTVTVLDVPTQPTAILGIDTVCIGTQNYSVAPQNGVNFNWQLSSGGTVLPSNNLATINWTTPGTHTITVTPSNSCGSGQAKSRLVFVKNTNAQITTISGENEPCLDIENYSVPSISGLTYNWNVSGGGTITPLGNTAFVDWTTTGIYTLSVATSDGCSNSLTVSVDDVPTQPSQIFGDTTVCLSFYNYSVLNAPNVNYIWTLSGGGILTQSGNAANVNWTQPGTYTLTATPSNDCGLGTPRSQTITVLTVPSQPSTITTTATNDTLACLTTETYAVNPQNNVNYNFSLSGNGTLVQNQNSVDITWLTASIDNQLLVTTSNICGTSPQQSLEIDVLNIPQVAPIQGNNNVCLNTNQAYVVPLIAENSYNWSLSSGGILTVVNDTAFVNWQTVGTHTLTVVPTNICGSGQGKTLQITVKTVPAQPIGFTGNTNACQTLEGYSVTALNNVNYNWSLSSGGSLVALSSAANVNWTTAGTHILTVTPSNECGIGTPLNQTVLVQSIPATPSAIVGIDSTCLNTSNSFSTTLQSGLTYNWNLSNGGILSQNANNSTINWNATGTQTISVSATNICGTSNPRTKTITVLNVPTQPTISGDLDVCLNDTEIYIATSNATNYTWNTTGGTVNGNTINWTTLGNQTLTVTPTNFCGNGASASANVVVKTVPNVTQSIAGNAAVCLGISTYSLPQITGVNYTWTLSGGGSITALNNAANINWTTTGTHTITAIPSNDCGNGNTITKQVTVNAIPTQPTAITGIDSSCVGTLGSYSTTLQSGVTYNWTVSTGGIVNPNTNNATINWNTTGSKTISVSATNICGTSSPQSKTITVLNVPTQPTISGDLDVCLNDTETYIATSNATNYTWNTSGGNVNGNTINWTTLGTQALTVTPTNFCGNGTSASVNVVVKTVPNITAAITGDAVVCAGISSYSLPQTSGVNYTWTISGGGAITGLGNVANINWITPGTHTITAVPSNNCGNGNTITKQITVRGVPAQPSSIQGLDTVCTGTQTYSVTSVNGITYNWSLGSGGVISANGNIATIIWTNEGTHTMTVTPQDACGTLGTPRTKTIRVQIPPQLTTDISGAAQVCNGETDSYFIATGITDWTYNWTIDNGNSVTTNGNQAAVDFNTIGNTTLSLSVSNQCGVAPTKTFNILVADNAPNVTGAINGDTLVCRNSDAVYTISGNSDFDYNWSVSGGGTVSALNSSGLVSWQNVGTYQVGVFASNFCGAGDTIFTTVKVEAPLQRPQLSFINDTLFSSNQTLSQWYRNGEAIDNATNFAFRPVNQGIYTVESENICGVTALSNEYAFGLEGGLFLYPNPGRYFITLRVPEYMTWYSVDAIDQLGRQVLAPIKYDGSNEVLIDVRNLDAGIYWFRIDTEIILLYRKVVIVD